MRFLPPPIADTMGEVLSAEDFESLAYNIDREMRYRPLKSQPLRIVELGTWSGQSTLAIARPHVLVHCISTWIPPDDSPEQRWLVLNEGEPSVAFRKFLENTKGVVFRTAMPVMADPLTASEWWPEHLDGAFINCDRTADYLRAAVQKWQCHIRPGGNIYGLYKRHTVAGLSDLGGYSVDGTIWRYRVMKEYGHEMGRKISKRQD